MTPSPLAIERLNIGAELTEDFEAQFDGDYLVTGDPFSGPFTCEPATACAPEFVYFDMPRSTDPADSLGLSWLWGFTVETLPGAAFYEVRCWHDEREKRFDLPVYEAARFALDWMQFIADNWPNRWERYRLQAFVMLARPALYANATKWRVKGEK